MKHAQHANQVLITITSKAIFASRVPLVPTMWTLRQILMNIVSPVQPTPAALQDLEANETVSVTQDSFPRCSTPHSTHRTHPAHPTHQTPAIQVHMPITNVQHVPQAHTMPISMPRAVTCVPPANSLQIWQPPQKAVVQPVQMVPLPTLQD